MLLDFFALAMMLITKSIRRTETVTIILMYNFMLRNRRIADLNEVVSKVNKIDNVFS